MNNHYKVALLTMELEHQKLLYEEKLRSVKSKALLESELASTILKLSKI